MGRKLTPQQHWILTHLYKQKTLTKKELMEVTGADVGYYANGAKHFGAILSRMVKRRLIHRPKKGTYSIGPGPKQENNIPGQMKLNL